jgi:GDPmannose 4,6-dehydratase
MKSALIIGITGQDGSYLAEYLLKKGYMVHGLVRRSSSFNTERIDHLLRDVHDSDVRINRFYGDLSDSNSLMSVLNNIKEKDGKFPDEIYNLGAQSHVRISFDNPEYTCNVVGMGTLRLLEIIRFLCPKSKVYQASSSEMFGDVLETPQTEKTPFNPQSPYACAKVFAYNTIKNYRNSYGLHSSNGILFNHESERRGETFVTKKITLALSRIKHGLQGKLFLGNLDAERDWGHAKDFVEAMWLILQKDTPGDYVIGTGEKHSVREFLEKAANEVGLNIKSNGLKGVEEKYVDENGKVIVEIDTRYFRPSEVNHLLADYTKSKMELNWEPKIKFEELVKIMIKHDLKIAEEESYLKNRIAFENKINNRILEREIAPE